VAERVVELLGDPGRRRAFGDAGRAFAAEHFAVERMVERINGVYLALVAQRACLTQAAGTRAPL
jgi:glycosyltransferase involved in cell wall biosynthesis